MKRIYIAGPMGKEPPFNFPAFHAAAAHWRSLGYVVINPAEINGDCVEREKCLRTDFAVLAQICDAIAVLPDFEKSTGAKAELAMAAAIEMPIYDAVTTRRIHIGVDVQVQVYGGGSQ